jgi:hypothetical protein
MRVQAYTAYSFNLTVTASTPRAQQGFSSMFTAGKIHEEFCARVRTLLKEHRHTGGDAYPAAKRLQTYFPTFNSDATRPLYAIRELRPAGAPRDYIPEFSLEVMRIRYTGMLNILPAAFLADEVVAEALERHIEYAVHQLFEANGVPNSFIPGDEGIRPGDRTEIDILCEMGPASERTGVEIPTPAQ